MACPAYQCPGCVGGTRCLAWHDMLYIPCVLKLACSQFVHKVACMAGNNKVIVHLGTSCSIESASQWHWAHTTGAKDEC